MKRLNVTNGGTMPIPEHQFKNLIELARKIESQCEYAHKAYMRGEADESLTHVRDAKNQIEYLSEAIYPLEDKLEKEQR